MKFGEKQKGFIFLWIAMLIFAAANSVIAKLGQVGAHHPIHGRNPISFCNVLFAANIIAGFTLLGIHYKSWNKESLKQIHVKDWLFMAFLAFISAAIGPTLFFLSLMLTQVINVVLISTLEIPLMLFFGWLLFKEKPSKGTLIGSILALIGVALTFFLHQPEKMPMEMKMMMINLGTGAFARFVAHLPKAGEISAIIGTFFTVLSANLIKKVITTVPVGVFSVVRMIVGAITFFFVVVSVFGWVHFIDIFSPFLWYWMLLYGALIVALGLWVWYQGLKTTSSSEHAITNAFAPIAGVFFAFVIVGEIPEFGQIIGGIVILLGIFIALFERLKKKKEIPKRPSGFSGV